MSERIEAWCVTYEFEGKPGMDLFPTWEEVAKQTDHGYSDHSFQNVSSPIRLVPESENIQLRALKEIYVIAREFYLSDPSKWGRVLSWCEHAGCKWEEV